MTGGASQPGGDRTGRAVLALNAGSSSLKFGLYLADGHRPRCLLRGTVSHLRQAPRLELDGTPLPWPGGTAPGPGHEAALDWLLQWIPGRSPAPLAAVGHRVVHGGPHFDRPVAVDASVLAALRALVPLAPLHMPHNLAAIERAGEALPAALQVACFDTAFHHTRPEVEHVYALPRRWFERGVRRYGFHGLSYEYIASVLPEHLGDVADGRVIVAHLGHGASLCALRGRRSVATTMGFTPLDGIPMATRPGSLDPGLVPWLLRQGGLSLDEVDELLEHRSGLLGLSGVSGDMRRLLASDAPAAALAVDYFVHHTHRAIASLAAAAGGLDALVFTGGIGEHAPEIRERICDRAAWLGIEIDAEANAAGAVRISRDASAVTVWRIPTDEETVIARHVLALVEQTMEERRA